MTQDVADFFAAPSLPQPEDWHMLQPFFSVRPRPIADPTEPDGRPLRVGLVCPYSFDRPGGVQNHVLGLARTCASAATTRTCWPPVGSAGQRPRCSAGSLQLRRRRRSRCATTARSLG